jgi:hypothetical protein
MPPNLSAAPTLFGMTDALKELTRVPESPAGAATGLTRLQGNNCLKVAQLFRNLPIQGRSRNPLRAQRRLGG